jgi:membrane-bound serine protease (ClpP class)
VFFVAEIKVPTHGVLTAGGILALVLGSLILFETGGAGPRLSWAVIAGATLATTAFFGFLVAAGIAAQQRRVTTGRQGLIGARAVALDGLIPEGRVRIGGELWSAVSETPVEPGANVEITGMNGLRLSVRPLAKEAHP